MEALEKAITTLGWGIGNRIVKVDMFLNHRLETGLIFEMGQELAAEFAGENPDLILTVEASGIALALATAHAMGDIPVVFAKKTRTDVQNQETVQAPVYSFTHREMNMIRVEKKYLPENSRVLIVDDFLADGQASTGMISLCEQCGCTVVGIGIGIEKGFQPGGKLLRDRGVHLKSLAIVESVTDGKVVLKKQD